MKHISHKLLAQPASTKLCEKHGYYESRNLCGPVWSKCPTCSAEVAAKEVAAKEVEKRSAKKSDWQERIGGAGIPERFRSRSLRNYVAETPEQHRALAFANSYADGFDDVLKTGKSAIFTGMFGTGKTHLACGIGLRIMQRDSRTVLFTTTLRAIRRIKETWHKSATETETQAIAALVFPDLLILDEVGVQFGSETEKLILFDIMNERYEKRRPTLLLSNLTIDEVREYLGERVFDRLREDGGECIPFDWESYRGRDHA